MSSRGLVKGKDKIMAEERRPRGREKNVTGSVDGVHRREEGLGTGKVGSNSRPAGGSYNGATGHHSQGMKRAGAAGGGGLLTIIIVLVVMFLGKGSGDQSGSGLGMLGSLFQSGTGAGESLSGLSGLTGSLGSVFGGDINTSTGWTDQSANAVVSSSQGSGTADTTVAEGSRAKRTQIIGGGKDTVTILVYMCGTDLESRSGMATSDLREMAQSDLGSNVNIIVYTGGCQSWRTQGISNSVNQIYQVKNGALSQLESDMGRGAMTDPSTLSAFIRYGVNHFPANRMSLIFWDHGGGSCTGYGYDQTHSSPSSMTLSGIQKALREGGQKFDFIGFDACLMATVENALMLDEFADYLIASEETEPGIGWYYTNWLNKLAKDTSAPTVQIGQWIVDDFVSACDRQCPGQQTTLSVVDIAELSNTVPSKIKGFAESLSNMIQKENRYQEISQARSSTREFAKSSRIDQIDLAHLAMKLGNDEGKALAEAIKGAVKYNRTSANMSNAYGLSVYFPYQRTSYVDQMCSTYSTIGMEESYSKAIRQFATVESGGHSISSQNGSGGFGSLLGSLMGGGESQSSGGSIGDLLGSFLSGRSLPELDLNEDNTEFIKESGLDEETIKKNIEGTLFDPDKLIWKVDEETGKRTLKLDDDTWRQVAGLDLNAFYDDGEGYIDLGLDNVYGFDEDKNMVAATDRTWLAVNGQVVAYYHMNTEDDGENYTITGRIPVLLNGERTNLIAVFDNAHPHGYIAGANTDYKDTDCVTVAKNMTEINDGDVIDFIADYYTYDGDYEDSYKIGDQITVKGGLTISDVEIKGDKTMKFAYRFTDHYDQEYWTPSYYA